MSWAACGDVLAFTYDTNGRKLKSGDKFILLVIAHLFNHHVGYAWPSIKTLSSECLVTPPTLIAALKRLEEGGMIKIVTMKRWAPRAREARLLIEQLTKQRVVVPAPTPN